MPTKCRQGDWESSMWVQEPPPTSHDQGRQRRSETLFHLWGPNQLRSHARFELIDTLIVHTSKRFGVPPKRSSTSDSFGVPKPKLFPKEQFKVDVGVLLEEVFTIVQLKHGSVTTLQDSDTTRGCCQVREHREPAVLLVEGREAVPRFRSQLVEDRTREGCVEDRGTEGDVY
eukprot:m.328384 g.328384  ORF g.328384 m.328384 type:complete len:172 (-) comp16502_c1_seq15:129-644(-)